jgi:hypothetical protein
VIAVGRTVMRSQLRSFFRMKLERERNLSFELSVRRTEPKKSTAP